MGFKLFSKHLDWKRLDTFLDWATHLILLRRDDAFAQYVSICLAQASNVWAAYPGSAKHDHVVSVDAALFDTWSKHEAAFVATVERALAKATNPPGVLHLTYERDLCAPHARRNTMRRVERFLGVAADRARADAEHLPIKQHKVDVRDHVSNFERIARVLPAANASRPCVEARRRLDVLEVAVGDEDAEDHRELRRGAEQPRERVRRELAEVYRHDDRRRARRDGDLFFFV